MGIEAFMRIRGVDEVDEAVMIFRANLYYQWISRDPFSFFFLPSLYPTCEDAS